MSTDPNFSSYGSEQQWLPSLVVDGVNYGYFDKFSGGDAAAAVTKYRPAGTFVERTYGALPVFSDVSITKAFVQSDLAAQTTLRGLVGSSMATITLTPLNDLGIAWGNPRVYNGRLSAVDDGNTDSTSGAVRMWIVKVVVETITG